MPYLVQAVPVVRAQLRFLHAQLRFQFVQICAELAESPHPHPGSNVITRIALYRRGVFSYFKPSFPYIILYLIFEPESGVDGMVIVISLRRID